MVCEWIHVRRNFCFIITGLEQMLSLCKEHFGHTHVDYVDYAIIHSLLVQSLNITEVTE